MTKPKLRETEMEIPEKDKDIVDILAQLPETAGKVLLYKEDMKVAGKFDYAQELDVGVFSLEYVREHWGGGKYRIRIKDGAGKWLKQETFSVAAPSGPTGGAMVVPLGGAAGPGGINERLNALMLMAMERLMNPPAPPTPADPVAQVVAIASALRQPEQKENPVVGMLLQELINRKTSGDGSSPDKMVETLQKMLALARELGGESDSSFGSIVKDALPVIAGAIQRAGATGPALAPPAPPATPLPPVLTPAKIEAPAVFNIQKELKRVTVSVLKWAAKDLDPETYAEVVLDQIPEEAVHWLEEASKQPMFVQEVFDAFPELKQYEGWVRSFLEALVIMLQVEEPEAIPPEPVIDVAGQEIFDEEG